MPICAGVSEPIFERRRTPPGPIMDPRMRCDPHSKVPNVATRAAFTDRHLRALRPGPAATEEWDTQQRDLIVRVLPSGRIEFAMRYRIRTP